MMLCSLSGKVASQPVVSRKSGHLFEKRLLLKYLDQNQQRCPVTGQELDVATDLVDIQLSSAATSSSSSASSASASKGEAFSPDATSIPQLLTTFQNEWDATMLELFTLQKHLDKTRQELSHALYQHDAACRVIARLNHENASLRAKLQANTSAASASAASAAASSSSSEVDVDMEQAAQGLTPEMVATIDAKQRELAKQRKDFKKTHAPVRAAKLDQLVANWTLCGSHTLHDADKPGVLCIAVDPKRSELLLSGGNDKHAKLFNTKSQQLVTTLSGHSKKLSHVGFHHQADLVMTCSYDQTIKLWSPEESQQQQQHESRVPYAAVSTLQGFDDAVTMASIHATGDLLVGSSLDGSWGLFDLRHGQLLVRHSLDIGGAAAGGAAAAVSTTSKQSPHGALCVQFHPDGGIFGTGAKNQLIQMWDVKSQSNAATFSGHTGPVSSLSFSENGYHLASGGHDGVVRFWDLRKLKSFCEIQVVDPPGPKQTHQAIYDVQFDPSGQFLAVATCHNVQILKESSKTSWQVLCSLDDNKAPVTGVCFAADSSCLVSSCMDRFVRRYQ